VFLWLILIVAIVAGCAPLEENGDNGYGGNGPGVPDNLEAVTVQRVIDGDTVELADGRRVRLLGINTPESEQPYYQEAKNYLEGLVEGEEVGLEYDVQPTDQYGRTLAYMWDDGSMVNIVMARQGYASTYTLQPNVKYQEEILAAERSARQNGRGLWQEGIEGIQVADLNADAAGNDNQNLNGEWVEVRNTSNRIINMSGYTLEDNSREVYTFDNFDLRPGQSVFVYTGCGTDTRSALYWCLDRPVWNNSGDAAILRDANGLFVDYYEY
jgi:micrococcal nuclease